MIDPDTNKCSYNPTILDIDEPNRLSIVDTIPNRKNLELHLVQC